MKRYENIKIPTSYNSNKRMPLKRYYILNLFGDIKFKVLSNTKIKLRHIIIIKNTQVQRYITKLRSSLHLKA